MSNKKIFNFTVGELIENLKQYPQYIPVIVTGYENFYQPFVRKVAHLPENKYFDGEFQLDEKGTEVLIFEREVRDV